MELAKYICMKDVKVIIGVGGGKVLDVAKYAGFVGKIPYICVPTTLSNDSLASPVAVLGTEGDARKTLKCAIPAGIVVDVNVVMGAPASHLQSGIGDTISKYTALGNSRPSSGSEHLFCHSLEENHKEIQITHGMAVALGSWFKAADTRKGRYTVLNEVRLTEELLGGIYEQLRLKK